MRHQFNQIAALAEEGNVGRIRDCLAKAAGRIPSLEMNFCENRAADSVIGYYCALVRREESPFRRRSTCPWTKSTYALRCPICWETHWRPACAQNRRGGVGVQFVCRIAEKNGGACIFTHQDGVFSARVMLRG